VLFKEGTRSVNHRISGESGGGKVKGSHTGEEKTFRKSFTSSQHTHTGRQTIDTGGDLAYLEVTLATVIGC
jgi:hypothetical protein